LVSPLEACPDVHRVADRGEGGGAAEAHLAEDHRSDVQADPDAERLVQIVRELLVELLERERHGRGQTLPARRLGWLIDAEERHDAVAQELVDPAALGLYRLAHRLKY
jgi:hypothetical protein